MRKQIIYLELQQSIVTCRDTGTVKRLITSKRRIDFNRIRLSESVYSAVNDRFTQRVDQTR